MCPFEECPLLTEEVAATALAREQIAIALAEGRVVLYRQDIVTRGGLRRFEILSRLVQGGEVVAAGLWLPALEGDAELSRTFDLWVLEGVLNHGIERGEQAWVNVAGPTVGPGFAEWIEALLEKHHADPKSLCIEVTEQVQPQLSKELGRLLRMGCDVALDDAGAGYSNWARIADYPLTWLKIDGPLVAEVGVNSRRALVAKHLIRLGKELRLQVVAEWVETAQQVDNLLGWGVDGLQGFNVPKKGAGMPRPWS
jgi:EAL domain-containing protein (putative c-di-GMP-specific phosphodiesterase class I)